LSENASSDLVPAGPSRTRAFLGDRSCLVAQRLPTILEVLSELLLNYALTGNWQAVQGDEKPRSRTSCISRDDRITDSGMRVCKRSNRVQDYRYQVLTPLSG
jgi:hypothetical protein